MFYSVSTQICFSFNSLHMRERSITKGVALPNYAHKVIGCRFSNMTYMLCIFYKKINECDIPQGNFISWSQDAINSIPKLKVYVFIQNEPLDDLVARALYWCSKMCSVNLGSFSKPGKLPFIVNTG